MTPARFERPWRRAPASWAASVAFALTAACGGRRTPPPDDALDDPVAVFEAMLDRLELVQSARILATLEYYGPDGRVRGTEAVLARAPASLRMEAISPFDTTLYAFMVHDGALAYLDLRENLFVSGSATPENISRFVPFALSAEDLVRVLLGGPPLDAADPDPDTYSVRWDDRAGAYALTMPAVAGGTLTLQVAHGTWTVVGARLEDAAGDVVFDLREGNFATVAAGDAETTMPRVLRLRMPASDIDISLELDRIELNAELDSALFVLDPPPGADVRRLP
ncbi:MAG: hypothetical protein H6698_06120 [Myxococcales bacterium]|nr:hypothetical protein [Myxococcales bacterium]MCB9521698.1 hypothetical protein [Myxococcales bacterium]MCB9531914.1 hypothetical protein [Myxococcales bacterium]MCB9533882.1 hypothetical protein [Myxococcales bacterium]